MSRNSIQDVIPVRYIEQISSSLIHQSHDSMDELGLPEEDESFSFNYHYPSGVQLEFDTAQEIEVRPELSSHTDAVTTCSVSAHHGQDSALQAFRSAAPSKLRQHHGHAGRLSTGKDDEVMTRPQNDSTDFCGEHRRVGMTLEILSMTNDAEVDSLFDAASSRSMSPCSNHGNPCETYMHDLRVLGSFFNCCCEVKSASS